MRRALIRHPDTPCEAVAGLVVEAHRPSPARLALRYTLQGELGALRIPPRTEPKRTDGLWRRTCFEAFLRADASAAYHELNFAPSSEWAAYGFNAYRAGMTLADATPRIEAFAETGDTLVVTAAIDLGAGLAEAKWYLALAAVIEERTGRLSYWALAHPPGKPDFHHKDAFTLEIRGASAS
ncbi:MAG: DOMON-like domain-containing protein [Alphaproteobacteria bacterium]